MPQGLILGRMRRHYEKSRGRRSECICFLLLEKFESQKFLKTVDELAAVDKEVDEVNVDIRAE